MDLRLMEAAPTGTERAAVDAVLGVPTSSWEGANRTALDGHVAFGGRAARERRHLLLPALHAAQAAVGWVSPGALTYISHRLTVPPAEAYGVATFYALLATTERPRRAIHVCDDVVCRIKGALDLMSQLEKELGVEGEPSEDGATAWYRSPCVGQCERAPAALIQDSGEQVVLGEQAILSAATGGSFVAHPQLQPTHQPQSSLLHRIGVVEPTLSAYRETGGYRALAQAIEMGPAGVIEAVKQSKLVGRGGAAFPAGIKWEAVASSRSDQRYLICNADESEPGTFKDRVLLEGDPFTVLEGMTLAAYATGCAKGYLYIRGEYPEATACFESALGEADASGLLGTDVMGAGFSFEVEIRRGAGAYICGEETALMNSIEGYRGEPRSKPPFPTEVGLFGKPTLINNVETFANVPRIVLEGGEAFEAIGTERSTGPKLFCLTGAIANPGVYEVPFGATLGQLIELAGGPTGEIQAVLLGGAAGSFLGPDDLDLSLSIEGTGERGVAIGSGAVILFDTETDLGDIVARIARFFRDESCGQCVPCRVGTVRQEEALARAFSGSRETELLEEIGTAMTDASICGLGQTAAAAVLSALRLGLLEGR